MCRRNQLWSGMIFTFGLGLLIGSGFGSYFICIAGGVGFMMLGAWGLIQK